MVVKCPCCDAALTYDVQSSSMICRYCGNCFSISTEEVKPDIEEDMMEFDIYNCTTCGAELIINDVESSTYCAYCGQPTIVWNRVSKQLKPQYIVPFKMSKEEALSSIKKRLKSGFFIPKEIKNFKVDKLRGIYIPFWIYDMDYQDRQYLKGEVGSGKNRRTKYFLREARTSFNRITVDASKNLNDISSQRLEPYMMDEIRPFNTNYFSGFYADCNDEYEMKMNNTAVDRAEELFNQKVFDTVRASKIQILKNSPRYNIKKHTYVMLPAWFLVFNQDNKSYTIMVNGQTGKTVGAVPYDKKKVTITFSVLFALFTAIFFTVIPFLLDVDDLELNVKLTIMAGVFGVFMLGAGSVARNNYKLSQQLTTANKIKEYVAERQDES